MRDFAAALAGMQSKPIVWPKQLNAKTNALPPAF